MEATDKQIIKKTIPPTSFKIITAAVARLYIAYPLPNSWTYTNVVGAVVFVRDPSKDTFFFKMVDLLNNKGIIWDQELFYDFQYYQDRTFFHSFACDDYYAGFSFADEGEASTFYKKVINREKTKKVTKNSIVSANGTSKKKKKGGIDKSMIGAPTNFEHIGHIGYSAESGFDMRNVDPSWNSLFEQLGAMGISKQQIQENADFIQNYVKQHGGIENKKPLSQPVMDPIKQKRIPSPSTTTAPKQRRLPPPPPPPSRNVKSTSIIVTSQPPPPPPPPRPASTQRVPPQRSTPPRPNDIPSPGSNGLATHPPPPPPRTAVATKSPPPIPSRGNVPPPPPIRNSTSPSHVPPPPPPPPPPPSSFTIPPPPPPPQVPNTTSTANAGSSSPVSVSVAPGRDDLLASIRSAGGIASLRKMQNVPHPSAAAATYAGNSEYDDASGAGGGDLASALAAALNQRKNKLGESDIEEEDDEWD